MKADQFSARSLLLAFLIFLSHQLFAQPLDTAAYNIRQALLEEALKEKIHGIQIGADPDVPKSESRSDFEETGAEPFIAINPNNGDQIGISFMATDGRWKLYLSDDGGDSWNESTLNTMDILNETNPTHSLIGGGDPVFTFDTEGHIHAAWIYLHGTNLINLYDNTMETFYVESEDFGVTWIIRPSLHAGILASADAVDRIWMDIDNSGGDFHNTIYVSGVHFGDSETGPAGQLVFIKPSDSTSFNTTATEGILPGFVEQTQYGNIAIDDDGDIHMTAGIIGGAEEKVAYARSSDGGVSFSSPVIIASGDLISTPGETTIHNRENSAISLAVDDDNVYVAWTEIQDDEVRSFYAFSHDNGENFSDPIAFSEDLNPDFYAATMPCVAADDENLAISWYLIDKETLETKYISAFSSDAGISITGYQTLSEESTNFSAEPSAQFYGDYNDAAMLECDAHFAWCDGRSGFPAVYHSKVDACSIGGGEVSVTEHTPVTGNLVIQSIYPNPAQENLTVELKSTLSRYVSLSVIDVNGKQTSLLTSGQLTEGTHYLNLDVSEYAKGTYILKGVTSDGYYFTRKWVKG